MPNYPESYDPQKVIAMLPIRPYHIVADISSGGGYLTIPLAKYLFDGKVYAVESDEALRQELHKRLEQVHLTNVESVKNDKELALIQEGSLDGVLLDLSLHATKDREAFLKKIASLLRKGGWTAILERNKKREAGGGPPTNKRIPQEEVEDTARRAGFRFTEGHGLDADYYLVLLRK